MARCLVTSSMVSSVDDPCFEPLVRDGHTLERVDTLSVRSEPALIAALEGVEAVIAGVEPYTSSVLSAARSLGVISRSGVGYDAIDIAEATRQGIVVCTTPGANKHAVADMALTLILACARHLVESSQRVRAGVWAPPLIGGELPGSTVGVIGTGLIGREVVKRLAGFEPRLLAYDVVPSVELAERFGVKYVPLDQLLRQSDFVSLHAPLLPATHHLIDRTALALMKPSAYLINTARGPLVDERALAEALQAGIIAGAALDVFEQEPLSADSPLRELSQVILTPHIAGSTEQSRVAMLTMASDNAARALRGEPPLFCLNPEATGRRAAAPEQLDQGS
jgi:phosphoglycerate dehydrogenase-like enzyme